jgi:antitoxin component YwqK of YwqJK toxin-antitoxin module
LNENNIKLKDTGPINVGISYEELKEGIWSYYDETGKKIKEDFFIDGVLIYTKE